MPKYMKLKILVIIILLFVTLAVAVYAFSPEEAPREFRGTFVLEEDVLGYLHQAQKESGFT